jgi:hypothetical protein
MHATGIPHTIRSLDGNTRARDCRKSSNRQLYFEDVPTTSSTVRILTYALQCPQTQPTRHKLLA